MFESPHREEMVSFPYARLTVITGIFVPSRLAEMVYPDRANSFLAAFPAKKQLKGPSMKRRKLVFSAIAILAAAAIGGGGYQYWKNKKSAGRWPPRPPDADLGSDSSREDPEC